MKNFTVTISTNGQTVIETYLNSTLEKVQNRKNDSRTLQFSHPHTISIASELEVKQELSRLSYIGDDFQEAVSNHTDNLEYYTCPSTGLLMNYDGSIKK